MDTEPDTAQASTDRSAHTFDLVDLSDETSSALLPDDDPRTPALYRNPDPKDVGAPSSHELVADSLYALDGKVLKPIKADRYKLLRMLGKDILDRRDMGQHRYGQTLQPGNGRDTLIDLYQEQLDGLAYAQTLVEEARDSDAESEAKDLYNAQLVLTLQTRAYLARRNGELSGGGPTPAAGA